MASPVSKSKKEPPSLGRGRRLLNNAILVCSLLGDSGVLCLRQCPFLLVADAKSPAIVTH